MRRNPQNISMDQSLIRNSRKREFRSRCRPGLRPRPNHPQGTFNGWLGLGQGKETGPAPTIRNGVSDQTLRNIPESQGRQTTA